MKKNGVVHKYTSLFLAATVTTMQVAGTWEVYAADTLEYAGTTQISTVEVYPLADTSAVELEVEEVYAEEGTQLTEGEPILKLTDESYQKALAYYEAAIIKAESTLTDAQLEYDQGVLEAKYTCETAEADAENAESIHTYQTNEVESALTDHEETLNDIDERIAELEAGIAAGSYDTGSDSGGASAGGSNASGSGQKKSDDTQKQSEAESEQPGETESGSTEAGQPGETESGSTEAGHSGSDENDGSTDGSTPGSTESGQDAADADMSGKTMEELRQELTTKMSEAEMLAQTLTEKLKSAMEQANTNAMDSDTYSAYTEQLKNIVKQLEADIESQKKVESILKDYDFSSEDANQATLSASITGDENVLSSLKEIQEKMTKYQTLISSVMSLWSANDSTALVDGEMLTAMSDYLSKQAEINELSVTLLEKYESTIQDLKSAGTNESAANGGMSDSTTENGDKDVNTEGAGNSGMPGSAAGGAGNASGGAGESGQATENAGSTIQGTGATGQNSQSALSDEDISLLGDTYDQCEAAPFQRSVGQ